jgi:hypothetical protein
MASAPSGTLRDGMDKTVYDRRAFRNLPREDCTLTYLFGDAAGECGGLIHLHHVDPSDPDSRLLPVCARHHTRLHAALRALLTPSETEWKVCPHRPGTHRYPGAKEECERRLNRGLSQAA